VELYIWATGPEFYNYVLKVNEEINNGSETNYDEQDYFIFDTDGFLTQEFQGERFDEHREADGQISEELPEG
jgi:hypothetical protein